LAVFHFLTGFGLTGFGLTGYLVIFLDDQIYPNIKLQLMSYTWELVNVGGEDYIVIFNYLLNYLHNIILYYILSCILDDPICSIIKPQLKNCR
jgi:hypothetical protein